LVTIEQKPHRAKSIYRKKTKKRVVMYCGDMAVNLESRIDAILEMSDSERAWKILP